MFVCLFVCACMCLCVLLCVRECVCVREPLPIDNMSPSREIVSCPLRVANEIEGKVFPEMRKTKSKCIAQNAAHIIAVRSECRTCRVENGLGSR